MSQLSLRVNREVGLYEWTLRFTMDGRDFVMLTLSASPEAETLTRWFAMTRQMVGAPTEEEEPALLQEARELLFEAQNA